MNDCRRSRMHCQPQCNANNMHSAIHEWIEKRENCNGKMRCQSALKWWNVELGTVHRGRDGHTKLSHSCAFSTYTKPKWNHILLLHIFVLQIIIIIVVVVGFSIGGWHILRCGVTTEAFFCIACHTVVPICCCRCSSWLLLNETMASILIPNFSVCSWCGAFASQLAVNCVHQRRR